MQRLFRDAIQEWNKAKAPPGTEVRRKFEQRLDNLLNLDVAHYGKDFQTLQNGIIKCQDCLFTFLDHEGVPHHNNQRVGHQDSEGEGQGVRGLQDAGRR